LKFPASLGPVETTHAKGLISMLMRCTFGTRSSLGSQRILRTGEKSESW
jgi:hypothetical protein